MALISAGFLWFTWGNDVINHDNIHILHALVAFGIILVFSVLYKLSLKPVEQEVLPDGKVSLKNVLQTGVEALSNLFKGVIPHGSKDYLPLLGGLFFFIFISNILGLVPGFLPPTENLNTNYAMAVTIFFYYHYVGIKKVGFGHYKDHFIGPSLGSGLGMVLFRLLFLAPLMFVIEIVGHCVRPFSLSLRLFGNIFGDHQVVSVFSDLTFHTPMFWVPVVFLAFGIFVSFVQAFVFTLLSSVYVALAVEHH